MLKQAQFHARNNRIANRALFENRLSYEAKGAFEKVVGEILTSQYGIPDAPESFFKKVQKELGSEMNVNDPNGYPELQRVILKVLDSEDML